MYVTIEALKILHLFLHDKLEHLNTLFHAFICLEKCINRTIFTLIDVVKSFNIYSKHVIFTPD